MPETHSPLRKESIESPDNSMMTNNEGLDSILTPENNKLAPINAFQQSGEGKVAHESSLSY